MSGHRYIRDAADQLTGSVWPDGTRSKRKWWAAMRLFKAGGIKRFPTSKAAIDWLKPE